MEGSESEEIFETFNLKPQLFINEYLNRVDELIDGAFDHFHHEAAAMLKTGGTDRSKDLQLGINDIQSTVQAALDERFSMWERYCLHYCFSVPSGFSLPSEKEASGDDPMDQDDLSDEQIDAQLDSLRNKLAVAGKECADLKEELRELERNSAMSNHCISAVNEALQLYDNNSAQDMFQEFQRVSAELKQKVDDLRFKQNDENMSKHSERLYDANGGLSHMKLNNLKEFVAGMKL